MGIASGDVGISLEQETNRGIRENSALGSGFEGIARKRAASTEVVVGREIRFPAQAGIDGEVLIDAKTVLGIKRKNRGAGGIFERIALREIVLQTKHEIGQRVAAECSVEIEYAVSVPVVIDVHLIADNVDAEGHLVLAADNIDIIGELKCVDVEVSGSAGAAADVEVVTDGDLKEIWDRARNIYADIGGIDHVGRGTAVVAPARGSGMKSIHSRAAENVGIAEREGLGALEISGCSGCQ